MDKKEVLEALQKARDKGKTRKFRQSVDLTINFKGIDFKKDTNRIDLEVVLPHQEAKKVRALVFVRDKGFASSLKGIVERVIMENEIQALDKKQVQELADSVDVLLAEGPVMITVGKFLGQILAPRGKMPKPVQPDVKAVQQFVSKSSSTTRITNKKGKFMPVIHLSVGNEKMPDEQLAENILSVYEAVEAKLPGKKQNVKSVFVKLTMGPPVKVGEVQKGEAQ
ncbi:MAG: 50S ribosomal protein L1 [Candidatus Diapherotrites archaeon]